ncbi:MAG: hypothetical protein C0518_04450 [Opitutus sp.]|nr:hypothetical protein [Opitutus sp.]
MTEDTQVELDALLKNIRSQFYTEATAKKFFQDRNVLLVAITWPASWLKHRGVTWSAERYFQTIRELLQEIKRHGATGEIQYFPGYLLKCVQDHFAHNSDTYCDEAKRTRSAFDMALGRVMNASKLAEVRAAEQTVDVLAEAHRMLASTRRRPKARPAKSDDQLSLL